MPERYELDIAHATKIAKAINQARNIIEQFLNKQAKNSKLSGEEQGYLEWVLKSVAAQDLNNLEPGLVGLRESPLEGLAQSLKLIQKYTKKKYPNVINILDQNSEDYFKTLYGKEDGIGMTQEESEWQHNFTQKEAYYISQPDNESYRNFLVNKYRSQIPEWDNLDNLQQDYQLAMLVLRDREVIKLKYNEKRPDSDKAINSEPTVSKDVRTDPDPDEYKVDKEIETGFEAQIKNISPEYKDVNLELAKAIYYIRGEAYQELPVREKILSEDFDALKWTKAISDTFEQGVLSYTEENLSLLLSIIAQETAFQSATFNDKLKAALGGKATTGGPTQLSYKLIQQYHQELYNLEISEDQAREKGEDIELGLFYSGIHLDRIKRAYREVEDPVQRAELVFADWNAGLYKSRNAGFQRVLSVLNEQPLDLDGTLGVQTK